MKKILRFDLKGSLFFIYINIEGNWKVKLIIKLFEYKVDLLKFEVNKGVEGYWWFGKLFFLLYLYFLKVCFRNLMCEKFLYL